MLMNIGQRIRGELDAQGHSTAWLSEQSGISLRRLQRIMLRESIDTGDLLRISNALGVDFFFLYSYQLHFPSPPRKG
jgi:lambda repressor-like predicted transcriptional regulator